MTNSALHIYDGAILKNCSGFDGSGEA